MFPVEPNCDRRGSRKAVFARPARPHRRDLRLCRAPAAGAPWKAAFERLHFGVE